MSERPAAIGVDGCPAGWVAAVAYTDDAKPVPTVTRTELRLYTDGDGELRRLVEACEAADAATGPILAVDVPMGLPHRAGTRPCDVEARATLGRRWMCVFPAPDRELLGLGFEQARAVVLARRAADPSGGHPIMTHQAMAIAPKIAEADALPDRCSAATAVARRGPSRALLPGARPRARSPQRDLWAAPARSAAPDERSAAS